MKNDNRLAVADRLFSTLVRQRDGACRICGSTQGLSAHHFVKRRYRKTRYVFDNAITVCWDDHARLEDFPLVNEAVAIELIGGIRYQELWDLARDTRTKVDLDDVIADLKGMAA